MYFLIVNEIYINTCFTLFIYIFNLFLKMIYNNTIIFPPGLSIYIIRVVEYSTFILHSQ